MVCLHDGARGLIVSGRLKCFSDGLNYFLLSQAVGVEGLEVFLSGKNT